MIPNAANGNHGEVVIARKWGEPIVLCDGSVNRSTNTILVRDLAFWSGDRVWLAEATAQPFVDGGGAPLVVGASISCWIYRDELDEVSFYTSLDAALGGAEADRLRIRPASIGRLVMAPYGPGEPFRLGALEAAAFVEGIPVPVDEPDQEFRLSEFPPLAAIFAKPPPPAPGDWWVMGDVEKWGLSKESPGLPSKGLGEADDDKTKDSSSGSGTITFLVRYSQQLRSYPALVAMRLTEMLDHNCQAAAKFYVFKDDESGHAFYQEGTVMFEKYAIDSTAAELIRITADFSVLGRLRPRLKGILTPGP